MATMTSKERHHLKLRLIETGQWNSDEPGDPTVDFEAAKVLESRASEKAGVRMVGFSVAEAGSNSSSMNGIAIFRQEELLLKVTGNTYAEAICFAVVALTALLQN
jgi:hypothetical protein